MNALFPTPVAVIAIDKGVPLPEAQRGARFRYPFKALEVGDSFFVPGRTRQSLKASISHASCGCRRFATRGVVEHGVKGLRVWRIV